MGGVDPQDFGELKGDVKATHAMLSTFIEDYKKDKASDDDKIEELGTRMTTLETKHKVGARVAFSFAGIYAGWKAFVGWLT
jgi:hypothetical protein